MHEHTADTMRSASLDVSSPEKDAGNSCAYVLHAHLLDGTDSRRHRAGGFRLLGAVACAVGLCGIISCIALSQDGRPSLVAKFPWTNQPEDTAYPVEMLSGATESADRQPRSALFQMLAKLTTVYSIISLMCLIGTMIS